LVFHIFHFCVHFYKHRFHFQTDSIAPFHSMVLVRLELFLSLFSLFFFLNRRLLSCDTVHCTSLPVWISVCNICLGSLICCMAPLICFLSSSLAPRYRYSLCFPLQMAIHSA
jgi:hypothetical protein